MLENIKIPKISQTHLHGIKDLSIEDINNILELSKIFKEHNKEKDKKIPILKGIIPPDAYRASFVRKSKIESCDRRPGNKPQPKSITVSEISPEVFS